MPLLDLLLEVREKAGGGLSSSATQWNQSRVKRVQGFQLKRAFGFPSQPSPHAPTLLLLLS